MINEQRVRLETQMSIYRQKQGCSDERVNGYFRSDYIGSQLLHTFVGTTIAYVLILVVLAFYNFEDLMLTIYSMNLASFAALIIALYIAFLAVFLTITYFVYSARYRRARRNLNHYYQDLHRLQESYQREDDYEYTP